MPPFLKGYKQMNDYIKETDILEVLDILDELDTFDDLEEDLKFIYDSKVENKEQEEETIEEELKITHETCEDCEFIDDSFYYCNTCDNSKIIATTIINNEKYRIPLEKL